MQTKGNISILFLFLIFISVGLKQFYDSVINAGNYSQTNAIIVEKYCTDVNQRHQSDQEVCRIKYAYTFDRQDALKHNDETYISRKIEFKKKTINFSRENLKKFIPEEDPRYVIVEIFIPNDHYFSQAKLGERLPIQYRKDAPWNSLVLN